MHLFERLKYSVTKRMPLFWKFRKIYKSGGFGGTSESVSGIGSTLESTERLRSDLAVLARDLGVRSILDAPCGDFHWLSQVNFGSIAYHGVDIVPEIIESNRRRYAGENRIFSAGDLRKIKLPKADLILCRDCLVHLSNLDAGKVLQNLWESGAEWILMTTFPELESNRDLPSGMGWRPLNLQRDPFNLPPPRLFLPEVERVDEGGCKALGLWRRDQITGTLVHL